MKLLIEYDFEGSVFVNKFFVCMLNGIVKFMGFIQRELLGDFCYLLLGVVMKFFFVIYDYEDCNVFVMFNVDVNWNLLFKYL